MGVQLLTLYAPGCRVPALPHVRSHADVASLLEHFLYAPEAATDWVAGLIDSRSRLFTIALLNRTGRSACNLTAANVYRAVLVLGARSVYLAHAHGRPSAPSNLDCLTASRVHAMGHSLGHELSDVLIFRQRRDYLSLRSLGLAVPAWRRALDTGVFDRPTKAMRAHQAKVNPLPSPRHRRDPTRVTRDAVPPRRPKEKPDDPAD
jgi:hypothetical protein